MEPIKMTKGEAVKFVYLEEVKEDLLTMGWVVDGDVKEARRGRPRKDEE